MKTATFALIFCVVVISANASFFHSLLNYTRLRGKLILNTTEGLNVDYNANLGLGTDRVSIDLANVGAHFNAKPMNNDGVNSGFNRSVQYHGGLNVGHGTKTAQVNFTGTADAAGDAEITTDNKTNATVVEWKGVANTNNTWNVSSGNILVTGQGDATLNGAGISAKKGQKISVAKTFTGGANAQGDVYDGENKIGSYVATKIGEAEVKEVVVLQNQTEGFNQKPNASYAGNVRFKHTSTLGWNESNWTATTQGTKNFEGNAWVQMNGSNHAIAVQETGTYGFQKLLRANDTDVGTLYGAGRFYHYSALGHNKTEDGTHEIKAATQGQGYNERVFYPTPKADDAIPTETGEYTDDKPKKWTAKYRNSWLKGAVITANDTGIDVNAGAKWEVKGTDSGHDKPWNFTGNSTVKGHIDVDNVTGKVNNSMPAIEEEKTDTFSRMRQFARKFRNFFNY